MYVKNRRISVNFKILEVLQTLGLTKGLVLCIRIVGLLFLLSFNCSSQTRLCSENILPGSTKTCYYLNSDQGFSIEFNDFKTLVFCNGSYKKTKRALSFIIENRVIQVRKYVDTSLIGKIRITHTLHGSPKDSLRFSIIRYLEKEYKTDHTGTVEFPYVGGPIEIIKYLSTEKYIINPENDSRDLQKTVGLMGDNFNSYDIYWGNGILPMPSKPTIIKMKKSGDKYMLRSKTMRYDEMNNPNEIWKKTYYNLE